jgi:GNAT superfamily N-acetyltransferase
VQIRRRTDEDIPALVEIADAVRATDRWPPHLSASTREFVAAGDPLLTLVAVNGNTLVGHVALHERSARPVMALASDTLGIDGSGLGVVARLFVDPKRRHEGAGTSLLHAATGAASRLGRRPILDVWTELHQAIELYERAGWLRLGEVTFTFTSPCGPACLHEGNSLRSIAYAGPDAGA